MCADQRSSWAILFANGELGDARVLTDKIAPQDFLVAVDGGLRHLRTMGLAPHLLIGDLDSVDGAEIERLTEAGVEIRRYPIEKDETDLELAIATVLERGYTRIWIIGALGGRLDQTLGNLFLLAQPALAACEARLDDGREEVFFIRRRASIEGLPGETVSLLPWLGPAEGITTQGLRYPLHMETLYPERTRGISNELSGEQAEVSVRKGVLLCIHRRRT